MTVSSSSSSPAPYAHMSGARRAAMRRIGHSNDEHAAAAAADGAFISSSRDASEEDNDDASGCSDSASSLRARNQSPPLSSSRKGSAATAIGIHSSAASAAAAHANANAITNAIPGDAAGAPNVSDKTPGSSSPPRFSNLVVGGNSGSGGGAAAASGGGGGGGGSGPHHHHHPRSDNPHHVMHNHQHPLPGTQAAGGSVRRPSASHARDVAHTLERASAALSSSSSLEGMPPEKGTGRSNRHRNAHHSAAAGAGSAVSPASRKLELGGLPTPAPGPAASNVATPAAVATPTTQAPDRMASLTGGGGGGSSGGALTGSGGGGGGGGGGGTSSRHAAVTAAVASAGGNGNKRTHDDSATLDDSIMDEDGVDGATASPYDGDVEFAAARPQPPPPPSHAAATSASGPTGGGGGGGAGGGAASSSTASPSGGAAAVAAVASPTGVDGPPTTTATNLFGPNSAHLAKGTAPPDVPSRPYGVSRNPTSGHLTLATAAPSRRAGGGGGTKPPSGDGQAAEAAQDDDAVDADADADEGEAEVPMATAEAIREYIRRCIFEPDPRRDYRILPPPEGGESRTRPVRIYADGVYDLFHYAHALQLRQAKLFFPSVHLIVGVVSSRVCAEHKNPPILSSRERYAAVRNCRWVDEVVEDAPWVIDAELLQRHRVDYVAHDEAPYEGKDGSADIYRFAKEQGKFLPTLRTPGVSTSELLARIVRLYRSGTYDAKLAKIGEGGLGVGG